MADQRSLAEQAVDWACRWWRAWRVSRTTGLAYADALALLRSGLTEAEIYTLCLRTGKRT